jgi:hypothetical protein
MLFWKVSRLIHYSEADLVTDKLLVDGVEILQTTAMLQWDASQLTVLASMTRLLQQAPELEGQVQMGNVDLGSESAHQMNVVHLQDIGMSFLTLV